MPARPEHTARARARRRWFPLGVCEWPGCPCAATERHHIDGDVWNNTRANISFLCREHHRVEQVRTRALMRERAGQLALPVDHGQQLQVVA